MTVLRLWMRLLSLLLVGVWLSGCSQLANSPGDEEKDPHFIAGKNRFNNMDYDGAMAAFERALSSNPKNAAAHLELGLLCEEKKGDPLSAMYHYQKHLDLRPDSNMAETIKQRMYACKLELVRTVSLAAVSRQVQEEMRRLHATNNALVEEVKQLKAQLVEEAAKFSNQLALASAQASLPSPQIPPDFDPPPERRQAPFPRSAPSDRFERADRPERFTAPAWTRPTTRTMPMPRAHVVRAGDTFATISRKYNVKISALQFANPTVDARKLRPGQVLNLPQVR